MANKEQKKKKSKAGRKRHPMRDEVRKVWLKSGGNTSIRELAEMAGVGESKIRTWKSEDRWAEELGKRHKGAQPGNRNAVGHGAPDGNLNAMTHGAYHVVNPEEIDPGTLEVLEKVSRDTWESHVLSLVKLRGKEAWLEARIREIRGIPADEMIPVGVNEMVVPKKPGDEDAEAAAYMQAVEQGNAPMPGDESPMQMQYRITNKYGRDQALEKLEMQLDRVRGRIQKVLDGMRQIDEARWKKEVEEKQYKLAWGKATGEFEVDMDAWEVEDPEE